MDTVDDNKTAKFSIAKLSLGLLALGVVGGVFFGGSLSSQESSDNATVSEQGLVGSESVTNDAATSFGEDEIASDAGEISPAAPDSAQVANWEPGMPIPEGYLTLGDTIVAKDAMTLNADGTMSWDPRFPTPKGHVVIGGFLYPEEFASDANGGSAIKPTPPAGQSVSTDKNKGAIEPTPNPTPVVDEPQEATPVEDIPGLENDKPRGSIDCPAYREDDPALYDECRKGFVAPTIEWVGYHSCEKRADGNVEVLGKVALVGGSYRTDYFGWQTATVDGYGIVSSVNASAP